MADANSTGNTVSVTPSDVRSALQLVGAKYPELSRAMEVAEKMVLRLQTRMDEANLGMCLTLSSSDFPESLRGTLEQAKGNVSRDRRETLDLSKKNKADIYIGNQVGSEVRHG